MREKPIKIHLGKQLPDLQKSIAFCMDNLTSPHFAVLGMTGSGKSRLLTDVTLQLIEQGVGGPGVKPRELEVAVLGNDVPEASVVGEIVPAKEFYDYEAKYELSGPDESVSIIPAKLTKAEEKKIRSMAVAAFRACDCAGLARVAGNDVGAYPLGCRPDARGGR